MTINTLAHFERFNLFDLLHGRDITVAGRTDTRRTHFYSVGGTCYDVWILGEISNMWLVHEPDMIGKPVNSLPVDWLRTVITDEVRGITKNGQLLVGGRTDHLVAGHAEIHRRDTCVCLCRHGPVAKRTVEPQTFHRSKLISGNIVKLLDRGVNRVREINRLVERLLESKDRDRLADPARDYESRYNAHDCHYTEATDGQHRQ